MIARRKTIHGPNSIISHSSKLTNAIRLNNNQKPLLRPITAFFPFYVCIYLFKYILLIMLLHLSHFLPPSFHSILSTPYLPHSSTSVHGHTYKFFGFYISYTILTLSLSSFYLSFMILILCTFPPSLPLPLPC